MKICKWNSAEQNFFGRSENENGTMISGGTDTETKILFPTDAKFPFLRWFCMVNLLDTICGLVKPNRLNNSFFTPCFKYSKQL
jgi:hypothetical protein